MTNGRNSWLVLAVMLVATLSFAADADARRRPGGPGGGRSGKEASCVRDCRADSKACTADLRDQARACTEDLCSDDAQAACEACEADRSSEACTDARAAGRDCRGSCREPLSGDFSACKDAAAACVEACPDAVALDRDCVRTCKGDLRECRGPARDAFAECRSGCSALKDAAQAACETSRCTEECQNARAEARACVRDCRADSADLGDGCHDTFGSCVDACPAAE